MSFHNPFAGTEIEQLSDEEFWSYAHKLASPPPKNLNALDGVPLRGATVLVTPEQYLRCELRSSDYLIPLTALHEIMSTSHDAYKLALFPSIPAWMVGVISWRGETIAVIDLDAYLSTSVLEPDHDPISAFTLLIAECSGPPIALLVSTITPTTLPSETPILDLCPILQDVVQHIKDTCPP